MAVAVMAVGMVVVVMVAAAWSSNRVAAMAAAMAPAVAGWAAAEIANSATSDGQQRNPMARWYHSLGISSETHNTREEHSTRKEEGRGLGSQHGGTLAGAACLHAVMIISRDRVGAQQRLGGVASD